MKHTRPLTLASLALLAGGTCLSANWMVVDRFEDPSLPGWHLEIPNINNPDRVDPNNPPRITVVPDPFGGSGNALEVFPGVLIDGTVNMFASLLIPEEARIIDPFPDVGLATMYLRVGRPQVGIRPALVDSGWGLVGFRIDEQGNPLFDEDGNRLRPTTWGHFSVMSRFEPDGTMDVRDDGVPEGENPFVKRTDPLATETWYELWYVIDHPMNTYRVYIRGGSEFPGPDPVLLYGVDLTERDARYRLQTFEDLAFFMIGTSTGSVSGGARGVDPMYYSEIHIDPTGRNLTTPPGVGTIDPVEPVANPFDALVQGEWTTVPNVGMNYGFQNGPGWSFHIDLGPFYSNLFPWIFHHPVGWLYYLGGDYETTGMFLYSDELGWAYTVAAAGGQIYIYDLGAWVTP